MTTFDDRPASALLVIDMQHGVVDHAHDVARVTSTIAGLVDRARDEDVPVVWIQHADDELERGSPAWEYVEALQSRDGEPVVHKGYNDSFEGTDLEAVLAERGVGRVVVTGAQTDACVRATLHGALVRGYDVVLVEDGHTTEDLRAWGAPLSPAQSIAYANMYWAWARAPGRRGEVALAADVDLGGGVPGA